MVEILVTFIFHGKVLIFFVKFLFSFLFSFSRACFLSFFSWPLSFLLFFLVAFLVESVLSFFFTFLFSFINSNLRVHYSLILSLNCRQVMHSYPQNVIHSRIEQKLFCSSKLSYKKSTLKLQFTCKIRMLNR